MKLLDGWKCWLVVVILAIAEAAKLIFGVDVSDVVKAILDALGWTTTPQGAQAATAIAAIIAAVWAAISRAQKARAQFKAGVPIKGLLSEEGYVQKAIADGRLKANGSGLEYHVA